MPIEFRCPQCGKLLRTPDGSSGKQATCPGCDSRVSIPTEPSPSQPHSRPPQEVRSGSPFSSPELAPGDPTDSENPFLSPSSVPGEAPNAAGLELSHQTIQFERAFSATWRIYAANWAEGALMTLCFGGLAILAVGLAMGIGAFVEAITDSETASVFAIVLVMIPVWAFLIWLQIGCTLYFLKMARGEACSLNDLFSGGEYFVRFLGVSVLLSLIIFGGTLLCYVPGIIFALMFMQATYVLLDRNAGIMESLNVSKEITYGNKLMIFAIHLVVQVVATPLIYVTCGLGVFAMMPFMMILYAVIYLEITGQPLALEAEKH